MGCHLKVCRALRKLATWNSDRHTKSIIKLLVQVLMGHWRERQGIPTAYQCRRALEMREQQENREKEEHRLEMDTTDVDGVSTEAVIKLLEDTTLTPTTTSTTLPTSQSPPPPSPPSSNAPQEQDEDKFRIQEPVENDFYDVLRLQSHFEDWDDEDQKDWNKQSQVVLSLLEMAGLTEMASEPGGPLYTLTSLDVKRLISALESNAFGMFDRTKKKPVCFGRGKERVAFCGTSLEVRLCLLRVRNN